MKNEGSKVIQIFAFICGMILLFQIEAVSQEEDKHNELTELSKQTQNPVANMYQVPLSYMGDFNSGIDKIFVSTLNLKPVMPLNLSKNLLLIFRAIIPVIFMPAPVSKSGLSDIQLQLYLSPKSKSKFIWGIGPIVSLPTGIPPDMCSGKWTAGPGGAGLWMLKHWAIGALITQRWSFAGASDKPNINQLYIDAFANYNFNHGWALGYTPEIYVNWNQPDYAWNLPVGLNVSKVFKIGKQPLSANLAWYYNVIRPADYPDMYIKAGLTFLFPKKAK